MGTITINGKTYYGNNIQVKNNDVYIDGKLVGDDFTSNTLNVKVEGDLVSLRCDGDVDVNGHIHGDVISTGSVKCKDVNGSVDAGGSVTAGNVEGDVDAGGSVTCKNVSGSIDAGGSVFSK